MEHIAILGSGTWGTVLAHLNASAGKHVTLWCRSEQTAKELRVQRRNSRYLPDLLLDERIAVTNNVGEATAGARIVVFAVPTYAMREVAESAKPLIASDAVIVSAAKGFEIATTLRMSQVLASVFPPDRVAGVAVLSGPNLAAEIARRSPATSVVACADRTIALRAATALQCPSFRLYTNTDVTGVEFGGALKNVVAIGSGIVDGLALGENAKASLLTRGLAEMTRLGVAAGAQPATFAGLSGLGDMVATCGSESSRNHFVGRQLAQGNTWPEIAAHMRMVAEGVNTTRVACELASKLGVRMPIAEQAYAILFQGRDIRTAMLDLLQRAPKEELE